MCYKTKVENSMTQARLYDLTYFVSLGSQCIFLEVFLYFQMKLDS